MSAVTVWLELADVGVWMPRLVDGRRSEEDEVGEVATVFDCSHVGLSGRDGAEVAAPGDWGPGARRPTDGSTENDRMCGRSVAGLADGGVVEREEEGVSAGDGGFEVDAVWVAARCRAGVSVEAGGVGKKDVDALGSDSAGGVGRGRSPLS